MTLRTDLTALLADDGLVDVDVDEAIADEHVRLSAYQRIISVAAASRSRDSDRAIVAAILRDLQERVSKAAVVALAESSTSLPVLALLAEAAAPGRFETSRTAEPEAAS